jgi:energy-coupling factor transporter ATP-binding protein EcfA2
MGRPDGVETDSGDFTPAIEHTIDPRRLLVDWANGQDAWVRRLAALVLSSRRPISDSQARELYDMYLAEKGLSDSEYPEEPPLAYPTDGTASTEDLRLIRLSNVAGVNALTTGDEIEFCENLTILYGENGAGKTGYARILKRLGALRDAEEILPNIHAGKTKSPTARIDFRLGDTEKTLTWNNEVGVAPFTRMSIFDTPAVNIRVDENLSYVYTPAEISLFSYINAGIRNIQELGAQSVREIAPRTNPFLGYFESNTPVYHHIESLGSNTHLPALESLSDLPPDAAEECERLGREVAALKSDVAEGLLRTHRDALQTLDLLQTAATTAQAFERDSFNEALAALAALRTSYAHVRQETFADGELAGPPDDEWQRFVAAAARYDEHIRTQSHVADDNRCLYCRQTLTPSAVALLQKYAVFLDDALTQQIVETEKRVETLGQAPISSRLGELTSKIRLLRESGPLEPVYETAGSFITAATTVHDQIRNRERVTDDALSALSARARAQAETALESHRHAAATLERQLADRGPALEIAESSLRNLTARIELHRRIPEIRIYVDNAQRAAKLQTTLKQISGLLRSLTEVSKAASEDLVNRNFAARFTEECRALRTPNVRLEFLGKEGQAQRRKTLSPGHRLSQILSEGEQKVLAIADFLAEAQMGESCAPIIFDDPVNSLDHRRLHEVADRIARLADTRQVVLFTHNIWLVTEMLARFEKRSSQCAYFLIADDPERDLRGKVDRATGPRWDTVKELAKKVNETLRDAAAISGQSQLTLVEAAYGLMRSWCEMVVEEVLLADVSRRYRANIMMGNLKKIRPDRLEAAITVIEDLFNRACRYMPEHSQPLPTLSVRPTLSEAQTDWQKAQDAVKMYRQ